MNDKQQTTGSADTCAVKFQSWLEQLEAIYIHYYSDNRLAGEKQAEAARDRHWQRYDRDK